MKRTWGSVIRLSKQAEKPYCLGLNSSSNSHKLDNLGQVIELFYDTMFLSEKGGT